MEKFLLLAKSASGAGLKLINAAGRACANLISDVIASEDIYVFAELLEEKNVQALESQPEFTPWLRLLEMFCYSNIQAFTMQSDTLPPLNAKQLRKVCAP